RGEGALRVWSRVQAQAASARGSHRLRPKLHRAWVHLAVLGSLAAPLACAGAPSGGAFGGSSGSGGSPAHDTKPLVLATVPPPPGSGGTMLLAADGNTAVAADPARDAVWWTDVESRADPVSGVALAPGDEPGRLLQDGAGFIHVVLRGAGAVATIDLDSGS